jgi:ribonuclease HI
MPWVRAELRGNQVYARTDAVGAFVVENGRVEVRYRPKDGKLYRASPGNLKVSDPTPLPDETCSEATVAEKKAGVGAQGGTAEWEAWTDGACSGNPGPAGLGVVLLHGGERTEISEYLGESTNNVAELTAVLRALEHVPRNESLIVRTDSQYSIGVLQKGWKAKANKELIATIAAALRGRPNVRLIYTPGHAGVALNERADALARMASVNHNSFEHTTKPKAQGGGSSSKG